MAHERLVAHAELAVFVEPILCVAYFVQPFYTMDMKEEYQRQGILLFHYLRPMCLQVKYIVSPFTISWKHQVKNFSQ
jgi:hypothetical protein